MKGRIFKYAKDKAYSEGLLTSRVNPETPAESVLVAIAWWLATNRAAGRGLYLWCPFGPSVISVA